LVPGILVTPGKVNWSWGFGREGMDGLLTRGAGECLLLPKLEIMSE
jgi:hypothetical protein